MFCRLTGSLAYRLWTRKVDEAMTASTIRHSRADKNNSALDVIKRTDQSELEVLP